MASIAEIEFILYVADQARSRDFYKDVLGLQPSLDVPGMTEFPLNAYCKLGLMPENGIAQILKNAVPHPSTGSGIPRAELYLFVADIPSAFARALQSGGKEISPPAIRSWGDTVAYVADPDGHILAFAHKEKNSE